MKATMGKAGVQFQTFLRYTFAPISGPSAVVCDCNDYDLMLLQCVDNVERELSITEGTKVATDRNIDLGCSK